MPATASSTNGDYLRALSPAWATLQSSLAFFAVIVILRFCVRRLYSWFNSSDRSGSRLIPRSHPQPQLGQGPSYLQDHLRQPTRIMDEKHHNQESSDTGGRRVNFRVSDNTRQPLAVDSRWSAAGDAVHRNLISRPPPAPPLTPPELSSTVYTLEGRHHSQDDFFSQPNPDYTSLSTPSSGSQPSTIDTSQPRIFSYNKTIPIGIPGSQESESDLAFTPSSYPPSSPILPPAPPTERKDIDVRGEIVTVLDDEGAGWTRHTRVYGGGVCLACAASGRQHGDGGFYGVNVPPEEKR